jgi:hypothetical protein
MPTKQDQADAAMAALQAGRSLCSITMGDRFGARIIRLDALRKWMAANTEWAALAQPLIEKNLKASNVRKGDRFRNRTHCKHGHSLHDAYYVNRGDGYRVMQCRTCHKLKKGCAIVPEIKEKVEALIKKGAPFSSFSKGGTPGRLITHLTLTRWRSEDRDFNRLIELYTPLRQAKIIERRVLGRKRSIIRKQTNDYHRIRAMVGEHFPGCDDVISNIFEALLNKTLKHEDIPAHIKRLKADHNRMFPTNFAKFGNSRLVSLDEVLFEDGSTTRGDTLSRGLWD